MTRTLTGRRREVVGRGKPGPYAARQNYGVRFFLWNVGWYDENGDRTPRQARLLRQGVGMTRTFIALELNDVLQRHLAGVIRQMAQALPGIRWVDPAGIHLTLAFLGELTDERLADARDATMWAARQSAPFTYKLSRLGVFGPPRRPSVIWMGITEPLGMLRHVHKVLKAELLQRGFEVDTRPFSPHFTLARVKAPLSIDEQNHVRDLLAGPQRDIVTVQDFSTEHIIVVKSELLPTGARYSVLNPFKLEGL